MSVSLRQQNSSAQQSTNHSDVADDSCVDIVTQLQQEVKSIQESFNSLRLQTERKMQQLKLEIAEESSARLALQEELEQLKKIVFARFGHA